MPIPTLRYDKMVENALRSVVREALSVTAEYGLPGAHHFYVTFRTDHPGVEMPDFLHAQYPLDMTIVLEHQFWGLEVDEHRFAVTLSFRNQTHRLSIPLAAITAFADPSVKFGLEFRSEEAVDDLTPMAEAAPDEPVEAEEPEKPTTGEVVKLDLFRKK